MRDFEILRYRTATGVVPFSDWLQQLDRASAGRVQAYVDRMKRGNLGRSQPVGRGVSELKIDFGPGYRVYYIREGRVIVVLLCGGDKGSQDADIRQAHAFAQDYRSRK